MYVPSSLGPVDPRHPHLQPGDDSAGASGVAPAEQPLRLFDVPELAAAVEEPGLSTGARRTRRWRAMLAEGIHPATRHPLAGNGETCATCEHHRTASHNRTYHKCARHVLGASSSDASDIRTGWPACTLYERQP